MKKVIFLFIFVLIVASLSGLSCSVLCSRNVAFAELPSSGVVGDNLIKNSNFTRNSNGRSVYTSAGETCDDWYIIYADSMEIQSNPARAVFNTSGRGKPFWRSSDFIVLDGFSGDITFSLSVYSIIGDSTFFVFLSGVDGQIDAGINIFSSSSPGVYYHTSTFNNYSGYLRFYVSAQSNLAGSLSVNWVKAEYGDEFTGYVYESYSYYGYQDGRRDGYYDGVDGLERYAFGSVLVGEYEDFTSLDYSDVDLADGETMSSRPYFTYQGDVSLSYVSDHGLSFTSGASSASLTTDDLLWNYRDEGGEKYIVALLFEYNSDVSISVSSIDTETFIYRSFGGTAYGLIITSIGDSQRLVFTLNTSFATINLLKFKCERSQYFTGFPPADSNSSSYNEGYEAGFSFGSQLADSNYYSSGYDVGYEEGSTVGYNSGVSVGYAQGYSSGLTVAENGSWRSVVSAMVDVPVITISSFLDFNVLGFNMLNVLRVVISFTLFFWVLGLIFQGKFTR